jgi:hypothetical protein
VNDSTREHLELACEHLIEASACAHADYPALRVAALEIRCSVSLLLALDASGDKDLIAEIESKIGNANKVLAVAATVRGSL